MSAPPFWRRLAPTSAAARALALGARLAAIAVAAAVVAIPLWSQWSEAQARAESLDRRAAALSAAAAARRAEAGVAEPDAALLAQAEAWLADVAPRRDADAAMLDLLSTIRLLAETSDVSLASVTPLDASGAVSAKGLTLSAEIAGLTLALAEARITASHANFARFLSALEAARPIVIAPALDVTARSSAADEEDGRLTARVTIAALSRTGED